MTNKSGIPKYLKSLIKMYPKIASGRKNFQEHHLRISKTLILVKKYFKIKKP